jgi:hypothetical protein
MTALRDKTVESVHSVGDPSSHSSTVEEIQSARYVGYDQESTRRLRRKIDFCLIPFLALLYLQAIMCFNERLLLLILAQTKLLGSVKYWKCAFSGPGSRSRDERSELQCKSVRRRLRQVYCANHIGRWRWLSSFHFTSSPKSHQIS